MDAFSRNYSFDSFNLGANKNILNQALFNPCIILDVLKSSIFGHKRKKNSALVINHSL